MHSAVSKIKKKRWIISGSVVFFLFLAFAFSLPRPLFDVSYSPVLYDREGKLPGKH